MHPEEGAETSAPRKGRWARRTAARQQQQQQDAVGDSQGAHEQDIVEDTRGAHAVEQETRNHGGEETMLEQALEGHGQHAIFEQTGQTAGVATAAVDAAGTADAVDGSAFLSEDTAEGLSEEFELLRAVWPCEEELKIHYYPHSVAACASVAVHLSPLTAGVNIDQFVQCELLLTIPRKYPCAPLEASLRSSRGLSDEQVAVLLQGLAMRARALNGERAIYEVIEAAREALTASNAPAGECSICLRELLECDAAEVARTPCFHVFHTDCLAGYWKAEWERQVQECVSTISCSRASEATILCPDCRQGLPWDALPQLHDSLSGLIVEAAPLPATLDREAIEEDGKEEEPELEQLQPEQQPQPTEGSSCPIGPRGRRQKRREAQARTENKGEFVWIVEMQNSATAHAGTVGVCSVKVVAEHGETEELVLNDGRGIKTGQLVRVEGRVDTDIGALVYLELRNTSAETWRPHWFKVYGPDGSEVFIYSRQWVAKGRIQKAYSEVTGSVGLRRLSGKLSGPS